MLKNKRIFLILLVLLFLFVCNSFSYGATSFIPSSVNISDEGLIKAIKSNEYYNNDNYCFFSGFQYGHRAYWYAFVEKKPGVKFYMVPENDYQGYKYYHIEASEPVQVYRYKYGTTETLNDVGTFILTLTSKNFENDTCYLECFSNCNIYMSESSNDFFLMTPSILGPIAVKLEMMEVLRQVILIIPLILVVVVSFLGLRKALRIFLTLLRRLLIILTQQRINLF